MSPILSNPSNVSWLEIDLKEAHNVLSWAVIGGGWTQTDRIVWHRVRNEDLSPEIEPSDYFRGQLSQREKSGNVVGFLTSASLENYSEVSLQRETLQIKSMVTAGLGNAVRIGDPPFVSPSYGTINILVQCSAPMDLSASLEAISLIAEARTLAVLEADVKSKVSRDFSTGTGTDCIAFASPLLGDPIRYTGKHTLSGHLIGKAVYESVQQGIEKWKEEKIKAGGTF
ncbi:adenosylcobinamide amidohydrolase [Leptospira yasudae]|uniref:Adenosylcobinamide amidohydrolase n=1 Tax=Leptospira yasudae TaxID=2202201 RepID=A0A6N4QRL9_9LEPT|nr:adenosylcobinamide amidohydrolase [Leptospira yasudae]TGL75812.1 adenosylcobinamide amidohydrolase [Leptospira yasudae]TGL81552.1 adenosylcobinamide amidohydrolase [Leptospira yasudae]TGL88411.1 adenosylcobinamide amidohydrolase [Leptospira yasudae]